MKNLEDTNVCILALTYGRPKETRQTWKQNLSNHRHPGQVHLSHWDNTPREGSQEMQAICGKYDRGVTFVDFDNAGISEPLNTMMKIAFEAGADYVITMGNDILEPEGWIARRVLAALEIPQAGVIAIPPKDPSVVRYERKTLNGWNIEEGDVIGNFLITKACWEAIGGFSLDYGNYGPIDLDYCLRSRLAGFKTIYLADMEADHICVGQDYPTREKTEQLKKAWPKFWANVMAYKYKKKPLYI
jgi:GT2 family glycosyltransferase